ncbi:MAG TPA: hypothetical protein VGE47_00415 [Burkholderiaceae bacterium]
MTNTGLEQEWLLLQKQHEHYEFAALALKGLAVLLLAFSPLDSLLPPLLVLLWLQEAIIKTFQARLGARLLRIEQGADAAMQLHSEWAASRPGGLALLAQYARSACRPTVAFPYFVLIVLALVF